MSKLFLASYFTEAASLLPDFSGEDITGKKVAFIPTAALHEEDTFYVDTDRAALQKLGLIVEDLEVTSISYEVIEKTLSDVDYIFVGGGSTVFLLQELKRKNADKLLIKHIMNGKLYIGSSAGSILLQRNIIEDGIDSADQGPDLNGDLTGLSIIDFYLYVHYGHNYWGDDEKIISQYYDKLNLMRISDRQAVTVDGEKIEIVTVKNIE